MELFIRKNNDIHVAFDELWIYPEFKPILNKYGKNDNTLEKILKYIYFTSSSKALPQQKGYSSKEAHEYAIKKAGLDDKFIVLDEIKVAQKFYREFNTNPLIEYIENITKSLRLGNKICKYIIDNQVIEEKMSLETLTAVTGSIKEVLSLSNSINTSIPKLLDNIKELKKLEDIDNEATGDKIRGTNQTVPDSFDAKGEIEDDD